MRGVLTQLNGFLGGSGAINDNEVEDVAGVVQNGVGEVMLLLLLSD